jgi:ABC-type sugar transport system ATPase subunit
MLELRNLSKLFPGIKALDNVSFRVERGEIHALCGENGAGKSTLLNLLTGNLQPDAGQIILNGQPVKINNPAHATSLGIAIVYQQLSLVDTLTVAENIWANRHPRNLFGLIRFGQLQTQTADLLRRLGLTDIRSDQFVDTLSPGQKQMVEIAKALSQNPDVLLLDEPTASLTEGETLTLFALIRQLREAGKAVVYISHRLTEIMTLADRVSVLKDGQYQGTFPTADLTIDRLVWLMVGRKLGSTPTDSAAIGEVLLSVHNLTGEKFRNIHFDLHHGEILGLAGLVGAGRTEIARAIFGIDAYTAGYVSFNGVAVDFRHPADAVKHGIGYLPEERKALGLFAEQTVMHNIVAVKPPTNGPWFSTRRMTTVAEEYRQKLAIRTPSVRERVDRLSGGNQQKTLLARWLLTNPGVLIVDEPTHGIDVGSKAEIYELLRHLARQGKGILLISSDLPELLGLADRILVIREGQLVATFTRAEATEERIMNVATT